MKIPAILRVYQSIYLVLLIVFVGYLFLFTDINKIFYDERVASIRDFSSDWTTSDGENVDLDDISAGDYGSHVTLTKQVPSEINPNDEICFVTSNANVSVYVDGEVCYVFEAEENITGMGYGRAYHTVNLGPNDAGKIVKLELSSVFASKKGGRIAKVSICEAPYSGRLYLRAD